MIDGHQLTDTAVDRGAIVIGTWRRSE